LQEVFNDLFGKSHVNVEVGLFFAGVFGIVGFAGQVEGTNVKNETENVQYFYALVRV